jgi:hypothetical protein
MRENPDVEAVANVLAYRFLIDYEIPIAYFGLNPTHFAKQLKITYSQVQRK